jgi:hypothetical protein
MWDERRRLADALESPDPNRAVLDLARTLRAEGMGQVAMFRLFSEQQQRISSDDSRLDAVLDTMDLIWGGPWAKGRALFDDELSEERLARE